MIRNVLTAQPNAELSAISALFFRERIGSMPIIDNSGKISGIITRSDVLRATQPVPKVETIEAPAQLKRER